MYQKKIELVEVPDVETMYLELMEQGLVRDRSMKRPLYQDYPPAEISVRDLVKRVEDLEHALKLILPNAIGEATAPQKPE
jgi:hypothetical protein